MKTEKAQNLIEEYLRLRRKMAELNEELRGLKDRFEGFEVFGKKMETIVQEEIWEVKRRFENTGYLLFGCRSRDSIVSVISCVVALSRDYEKDGHYHDLLSNLISKLRHFEENDTIVGNT